MFDPEIIREHYASMYDEELIELAKTESAELTDEALVILKEEFRRRGISPAIIDTGKESKPGIEPEAEVETEQEPIPKGDFDLTAGGLTYPQMMYEKIPEETVTPAPKEELSAEQIKVLMDKASKTMLINGLIFIAGLVITIASYTAASEGGTYVLAWGAIIFGGIKFFEALATRHKLRSIQTGMNVISGEKEQDQPDQ